jgi:hypothetical protein
MAFGILPPMNGCMSNVVSGDGNTGHSNCGDIFELLFKEDVSSGPPRIGGAGDINDARPVPTDLTDSGGTGADACVWTSDARFGRGP